MPYAGRLSLLGLCLLTCGGCDRPQAVNGGTQGIVHAGRLPLRDLEVTVHRAAEGGCSAIGSGISGPDGWFALIQPQAAGPLWLPPGEYCFTVASVGAEPVRLPPEYADPARTPLKTTWTETDHNLDLDVPTPTPLQ